MLRWKANTIADILTSDIRVYSPMVKSEWSHSESQ